MPIYGPSQERLADTLGLARSSFGESLSRLQDAGLIWIVRFAERRPLMYYVPGCALLRTEFAAYYGNVEIANSYGPFRRFEKAPRRRTGNYSILNTDDDSPTCIERHEESPACDCLITFLAAIGVTPELFEQDQLDPFYFGLYWAEPDALIEHLQASDVLERLKWNSAELPGFDEFRNLIAAYGPDTGYPDVISPDEV